MARVKSGVTAKSRHKKVLKKAKGYYGARSKLFKTAASGSFAHCGSPVSTRQPGYMACPIVV
jgi:ribosomal protein L20